MAYGQSTYGTFSFGTDNDNSGSQEYFIDLMAYLPEYYQNVKEVKELQEAFGYKTGKVVYDTRSLMEQCFVDTATWGIDLWEKAYGLTVDKTKPYERRREIIRAKMRGSGTTTKELIKNVAIAFSGGEVAIQEFPQEYRFVVQFIGVKGIPQNMAGLIDALDEIKPAHLAYSFKYTYTVWNQIAMTWQQAKQKTWGDLRVYEGE
jgi:hypothetical protein